MGSERRLPLVLQVSRVSQKPSPESVTYMVLSSVHGTEISSISALSSAGATVSSTSSLPEHKNPIRPSPSQNHLLWLKISKQPFLKYHPLILALDRFSQHFQATNIEDRL